MTRISTQKKLLLECASAGTARLSHYFSENFSDYFISSSLIFNPRELPIDGDRYLHHNNPNFFYCCLNVLLTQDTDDRAESVISNENDEDDLDSCLTYLENNLYRETEFEKELSTRVSHYSETSDEALRQIFSDRIDVQQTDILSLPTDKSIYFAKVNHGYWDHMRAVYDTDYDARTQFRVFKPRTRRLKTSCVTQAWGQLINRYFHKNTHIESNYHSQFCISLTNGMSKTIDTLNSALGPVTVGAAVGILSMFDAARLNTDIINIGDGGATRNLISDRKLEAFFELFVCDSDACLFVVPPHLKHLDFVNYKGCVHKFIVPASKINETWTAVAATLLGYLERMTKTYSTITILVQGASVASLIALLFNDMNLFQNVRLRYFDLGRVLDVADANKYKQQPWLKDDYFHEGRKVFNLNSSDNINLVTPI